MHGKAYAVRRTQQAATDDTIAWPPGVTAVHADGGLRAVCVWSNIFSSTFRERSSGACKYVMQLCRPSVVRRWENQRMLSSF